MLALEVGQAVARCVEALQVIHGVDDDEGVRVVGGEGVLDLFIKSIMLKVVQF